MPPTTPPVDDPKPADVEEQPDTGVTAPDWEAEAKKWKTLARKHEGQAKTNADAATRLKDLEDADKSAIDRATAATLAAVKRAEEAEAKALRAEVASEKGLTLAQSKRLIGTTREELEADADELAEAFGAKKGDGDEPKPEADKPEAGKPEAGKGGELQRRPQERLRSGSVPSAEPEKTGAQIAEELLKESHF